jgi:hypothetical protein
MKIIFSTRAFYAFNKVYKVHIESEGEMLVLSWVVVTTESNGKFLSDCFVISATTMCMNVAIVKMTQSFNEAYFVECNIQSVFKL